MNARFGYYSEEPPVETLAAPHETSGTNPPPSNPPAADRQERDERPALDSERIIKVSSRSRSTAVAGAIAAVIRGHRRAEIQAIGAGAVNQAVKALAIAGTYLVQDRLRITSAIYFTEIEINGEERTALRFSVSASDA